MFKRRKVVNIVRKVVSEPKKNIEVPLPEKISLSNEPVGQKFISDLTSKGYTVYLSLPNRLESKLESGYEIAKIDGKPAMYRGSVVLFKK